jgi:hypothetical protein
MGRDRYEREHRRTHRHPACVEMMAGANFEAAPSLAEAMGLEGNSMRATYVLERFDGVKTEIRRAAHSGGGVLHLEHRELKPDGTPHDDRWYRVTDAYLLWMQQGGHAGRGIAIIDRLSAEQLVEDDPAYAGLSVGEVADLRHRGFAGKFPELTDAENNTIFQARVRGFGSCFPAYPDAETQARKTLAAARKWLDDHRQLRGRRRGVAGHRPGDSAGGTAGRGDQPRRRRRSRCTRRTTRDTALTEDVWKATRPAR